MLPFGLWVKEQRQAKQMTETECADRAGMYLQQWNRMEKKVKNPKEHTVEAVAKGLKVDIETVYAAAGIVSPQKSITAIDAELAGIVQSIPQEKQSGFIRSIRLQAELLK